MLEKLLFRKIEVWQLLLTIVIGAIATGLFGFVVLYTSQGGKRAGSIGEISVQIANFPRLVKQLLEDRNEHQSADVTWADRPAGFTFATIARPPGYVLLSRYDGNVKYSVTELIKEGDTKPLARWLFNDPTKYAYKPRSRFHNAVEADPATMRATHPLLDDKGELIFHFNHSPLYRMDTCSKLIWRNDDFSYHHSLEVDADGNFWSPAATHNPISSHDFDGSVIDDHLVQVSPDGKTLFSKSVIEILIENDLINLMYVYDKYQRDPIHLNDVQPTLSDGPYWRRGDVFLSLGHLNMLMLYRPAENKLVWWSQKRVAHQHDIDILDSNRIGVYNNNRTTRASGNIVIGQNEVLIFDFKSGEVTSPWAAEFAKRKIKAVNQGLADYGSNGSLLIEETSFGRLIKMSANGDDEWEYINKSNDGKVYTLNWSRYIEPPIGDKIIESIARRNCDG